MSDTPTPKFLDCIAQWSRGVAGQVRVLEIGGGSKSYLGLTDAHFTSIEPTPESLARSSFAHERLLGDAQAFDYGDRRFDAVVFWNVLEHIPPRRTGARARSRCWSRAGWR